MQRYVVRNEATATIAGAHARLAPDKLSSSAQAAAMPSVIQTNGKARSPFAPANHPTPIASRIRINPTMPGLLAVGLAETLNNFSDSAAQSARARCSSRNQRKLQRKTLAV